MAAEYDGFVMYPPRPKVSIRPETIKDFPKWWGQYQYNGTRAIIIIDPDRKVSMFNRHGEELKNYNPTKSMKQSILSIAFKPGWCVLDGELMHNKEEGIRDTFVLYDLLVFESQYLVGTQYAFRYGALCGMLGVDAHNGPREEVTGRGIAVRVNSNLWLAPVFDPSEEEYSRFIDMNEVKGLVLKDPLATLQFGVTKSNNEDWLVKVRKPNKNYEQQRSV